MRELYPEVPIAVITAHGNMESAIQALKAGAFDFVSKPVNLHVLRGLVAAAMRLNERAATGGARRGELTLLGSVPQIQEVRDKIKKLARSQAPIYISGESGTGKELVARMIHEQGPRAEKPFIAVNCGAMPEALVESEFFGYKKGSFTGAATDKEGLFQAANGGTLFLDEVADLPLAMQVKLLRVLQEKSVRPIGESKEFPIDVRILSATHKDLGQLVKEGTFRQDLFYRINVIEVHLPSLRERPEDIPLLVDHILKKLADERGELRLSKTAMQALCVYPFPGNVRELENVLERAVTLCEGSEVHESDLALPGGVAGELPAAGVNSLEPYLDSLEKEAIMKALQQSKNNKTAAARLLGITFRALRYRLKKLGLED
jgi:two-component system response regulator PilR (NtrC family)